MTSHNDKQQVFVISSTEERDMLVSAIIPTYNRAYIVGRAIESVLAQTYNNIEIIVVDDGSSDDTREKLKEYGDKVRVVYQVNAGPAAARNHGIEVSHGEFIAFLDSDDIWMPSKIERQVALLQAAPASVPCCLCNGITSTPSGAEWRIFDMGLFFSPCEEGLWLNVTEVLATRFILFCQVVMIRREALQRVGYFDPSMRFMEDYDLALRLSIDGPWGFIQDPLAHMTVMPNDSLSTWAQKREVSHALYTLKTCERVFSALRGKNADASGLRYLTGAIRKARRDLWAARLRESNQWAAQVAGSLLKMLERYRMAIFRRSPWFPKIKAVPLRSNMYIDPGDSAMPALVQSS